jgi:hypothetical protein
VLRSSDPDAAFAVLRVAEPDLLDRDGLADLARTIAAHRAWVDALQVRVTRRQRQLAAEGRAEAPRDLLAREGGQSGREARAADEREHVCSALPNFEEALSVGSVSAGHVDAIAAAVRNLDEPTTAEFLALADDLLADAERHGVDLFGRNCRDLARFLTNASGADSDVVELERQRARSRVKRWTDQETGMRHTHIELDPVRDAVLWTAIDRARRQVRRREGNAELAWDQVQVEAVIAAVSSGGREPGERVVELSVLIDFDTLAHGVHEGGVCELSDGTPLPVATVRQMACEASIIPIVLSGDGRALDVGRSKRLATEPQRQALRAMHRTCVHPDCDVTFDDCRIHHIVPWEHGGSSDLDNLAPLCETGKHHHLVHEGGWALTMTPERIATWTRPDGTIYWTGSTIDRTPTRVATKAA